MYASVYVLQVPLKLQQQNKIPNTFSNHPPRRRKPMNAALRIFSYLPNPRLWKATIAARIAGIELELRTATPDTLANWLWDFDARLLSAEELASNAHVQVGRVGFAGTRLHKTAAFLAAHPFGTVPAAFSPDGATGIFESNSIARTVARLDTAHGLYGDNPYTASRIDSFLDASLVFGRDTQPYLLALRSDSVDADVHRLASSATLTYLNGIERALAATQSHLVGARLTLADICFVCELTMLWYEKPQREKLAARGFSPVLPSEFEREYAHAAAHFARLRVHPAFAPDLAAHLDKLEGDHDR
jgi:elongation factor 1-gamma